MAKKTTIKGDIMEDENKTPEKIEQDQFNRLILKHLTNISSKMDEMWDKENKKNKERKQLIKMAKKSVKKLSNMFVDKFKNAGSDIKTSIKDALDNRQEKKKEKRKKKIEELQKKL